MAKSTRAGGATFTQHELTDPHPPVVISRAELGRVDQLAGTDYLEPLSSAPQSSEHVTQSLPGPAHTTENLFSRTGEEAEDSFADSTVGDGPTEISKPYDEMTVAELQDECRGRGLAISGRKDNLIDRLEENDAENEFE